MSPDADLGLTPNLTPTRVRAARTSVQPSATISEQMQVVQVRAPQGSILKTAEALGSPGVRNPIPAR